MQDPKARAKANWLRAFNKVCLQLQEVSVPVARHGTASPAWHLRCPPRGDPHLEGSGDPAVPSPSVTPQGAGSAEDLPRVCAACRCQPLRPVPCVALTLFCSVFRLHPPSFLFVFGSGFTPRGFSPPPCRFSFQFSTTMALAPACPLPAGEGCSPPAGKHVRKEPAPLRARLPRVRACVQGLPREGGRIGSFLLFFHPPKKKNSPGVPAHTPFPAISLSSSSAVPSSAAPTPQKLWFCTVQPPPPDSTTELSGPFGLLSPCSASRSYCRAPSF